MVLDQIVAAGMVEYWEAPGVTKGNKMGLAGDEVDRYRVESYKEG